MSAGTYAKLMFYCLCLQPTAHLRSVALELKMNNATAADAVACLPRLQQYFCWQKPLFFNNRYK
jgi:hypothetical protein